MNDIQKALTVLGLGANATRPEIKKTYRDLAKLWHPDRFPDDPSLRSNAQEKLKEINGAYHILRDYRPEGETRTREEWDSRSGRRPSTIATSEAPRRKRTPPVRRHPEPSNTPRRFKTGFPVLRWACIIGLLLTLGIISHHVNLRRLVLHAHVAVKNPTRIEVSKRNFASAPPYELAPFTQKREMTGLGKPIDPHPKPPQGPTSLSRGRAVDSPNPNQATFTVDSTKEEVLALQGPPTEFDDRVFTYGNSKVYFSDGRVASWDNSPTHPLKTRLVSSKPNMPNKGYFTMGSKKEEVLAVQGMPSGFTERVFEYGSSKVYFSKGRVIGWDVQAGYPLEVKSVATERHSGGN